MPLRKTLLILIACLWVVSSCTPPPVKPPDVTAPTPTEIPPFADGASLPTGDSAVWIGWLRGPDNPNPFLYIWPESVKIFNLVYSTLFRLEPGGTYIPDLVESVTTSPDKTLWTFTIRSGVTFHDGFPLTARDVAFSLPLYGLITDVSAVNDTTVEIRLHDPIPNMEGHLINYYILPLHIWGRYENSPASYDNLEMTGSGPFQMVIYAQNNFVHLHATPNHYAFPPKIEDVVFQVYPDETLLIEAFKAGDLSLIINLPYLEVESLVNEPNIEVVADLPLYAVFEEIIFNQLAPEDCPVPRQNPSDVSNLVVCSGHPALRDINVRRAMAHAVDKNQLIENVLLGHGDPGVSFIPSSMELFFASAIQDYSYDPGLANQILDEAGYLDTNGDGIREMPAVNEGPGLSLTFRFNYPGPSIYYERLTEELSQMWQEIGIALTVQGLDFEILAYVCCPNFDYDIIVWAGEINPEPGYMFDLFSTDEISTGFNETGFSDPDYDLYNAIQHTEIDEMQRINILKKMQSIIHSDVADIVPFYPYAVAAYRTDQFTGWITDAPRLALEDLSSLIQIEPAR